MVGHGGVPASSIFTLVVACQLVLWISIALGGLIRLHCRSQVASLSHGGWFSLAFNMARELS